MAYEVLMGGTQGEAVIGGKNYQYLFPRGTSTTVVPTADANSQFRSSDYNPLFYNPNLTYLPWVQTVNADGTLTRYPNASATSAKYDPASSSSAIQDLTAFKTGGSTSADVVVNSTATMTSGSIPKTTNSLTVSGVVTYDCTNSNTVKYSSKSTNIFTSSGKGKSAKTAAQNCAAANPTSVSSFGNNYTIQTGQSWQVTQVGTQTVTVNLPDWYWATYYKKVNSNCGSACVPSPDTGFWLQKIIIASGTPEMQNFANWFQYARSRRQLLSYAMSSVLTSVSGIRVGIIPFNSSNSGFTMYDMDTPADTTSLLAEIYTTYSNNSTPTHGNLKAIGDKFNNHIAATSSIPSPDVIQYACQKNAAFILTDGFANDSTINMPSYVNNWFNSTPYTQIFDGSLADIASYYYTTQLRTDLAAGQVPKDTYTTDASADQNTNLHMNTYALTLGAEGIDYQIGIDAYVNPPAWDNPVSNQPTMIDDLWHSTINGRGQMFTSDNVTNLIIAVKKAFTNISLRAGTRASIGIASKYLNASNNYVYVPSYNATGWVGDVKKYTVDLTTGAIDTTTALWSAKDQLNGLSNPETSRYIATYDGTTGKAFTSTVTSLDTPLVSFVRGNSSLEGTTYRDRVSLLGDIINATPAVITTAGKTTVYQPSNDGMVHAFDSTTGDELWAYVPKGVWSQFANFAAPLGTHEYIVDGSPISATVGTKTVLVGGLGYNIKSAGYYSLDISDPTAASDADVAKKVMWEFPINPKISSVNQAIYKQNLGTSTSRPLIIKTAAFTGLTQAVVISSGYNNGVGTGQTGGDGKGHVWFLDPLTGEVKAEITTATGSTGSPIGLAPLLGFAVNPKVDTTATSLYGGDQLGNVWRFDISSSNTSNWTSTIIVTLKTGDATPKAQPVTSAVQLSIDPLDLKPIIFIGTGQLFSLSDVSDTTTQSFYAIKDVGGAVTTPMSRATTSWVKKVVTVPTGTVDATIADRNISDPAGTTFNWTANKAWYFDYYSTGERVVGNVQFASDRLLFSTTIISSNSCTNSSFTYSLDSKGNAAFPIVNSVTAAITYVGGHYTGQASSNSPSIIVIQSGTYGVQTDASGKITTFKINTLAGSSRLASWREIIRK